MERHSGGFEPKIESRANVPFVDDEPMIASMGKDLLGGLGYHARTFTDPMTALDCFSEAPDAFDVVVTDLTMPGISGIELAERILQVSPEMPIIVCTGYSSGFNEKTARQKGVSRLLNKPLGRRELSRAIQQVLQETPEDDQPSSESNLE